ncbi:MBL fold hydrolase [Salinigranum rubrum]|uniref:MBL fold hydrolase n=1 Tax=Salinigranum rubrum TaxID=755307 RepID=A0A2I8VJ05_9EURY|nr:MBL fold metallo-hydrolase [Salinigranum rubrum]AUV81039.1 MBL fold hydrolase [Salinigranum rubrum]
MQHTAVPVDRSVPTGTTNSYLVGSDRALLVDPPARHADLDALLTGHTVEHLAVTHTHPDHVGGVAHYAAETGATVWARRGRERAFEAAAGLTPDRVMAEGTVIDTDDGSVTVLDTPGHARDHVAFEVREDGNEILCGDLAVAEGSVVVGAPEGDMRAYLTSLRRLRARAPARLHPGHGPHIDDPRATLDRLIDHRLAREARVRAAVDAGARTLGEVVDAAYDKDVSGVRSLAIATVRAHVEKLAVEGKVRWDPESERVEPSDGV